jgi:hypothetical protein
VENNEESKEDPTSSLVTICNISSANIHLPGIMNSDDYNEEYPFNEQVHMRLEANN